MAGVDIKTVASRAGHSMASTTSDIYSHFMRSSDIKASNIIDNIFDD
jgi:integrase